jgi:sodium transport system permease protein
MNTIWIVFRKELVDTLRDRRTMMVSLIMGPLLSPLLMMGLFSLIGAQQVQRAEKSLEVAVAGQDHAPNLVAWLQEQGVVVKSPPKNPEAAVLAQDEDVVLRIAKTYSDDWKASKPAMVEIISDTSRDQPRVTVRRVEALLQSYDRQVGALRLIARGVHPSVAQPLAVAHRDVATLQNRMAVLLGFLPYLLILSGFLGGAHLAMDSTAGERERQSLEPLLANPVPRSSIMSGKLVASSVFALAMLAITLCAFKLGFQLMPSERLGFKLDITWLAVIKLYLILIPLVMFGSGLLILLSATAKSYKEAQSYMALLMLLPMLPTIILMVSPVKTQLWMLAVPFLTQNQMISKVLRGEAILPTQWLVCLLSSALCVVLIWLITARLYQREQLAISA